VIIYLTIHCYKVVEGTSLSHNLPTLCCCHSDSVRES